MRLSFTNLALACAIAFSIPAFAQDAGTPDAGTSDAGMPDVDGGAGPVEPGSLAPTCTGEGVESTCGTGNICLQGFCATTCTAATCTNILGDAGSCFSYQGAPQNQGVCLGAAPQGGLCGAMLSVNCAEGVCLTSTPNDPGFCNIVCSPADPTTCTTQGIVGTPACGCTGDQVCSTNPLALQSGDGVCAPANIDGTCGINSTTGELSVCTNGQTCDAAAADVTGNCVGTAQPNPDPTTPGTDPTDSDAGTDPTDSDAGTDPTDSDAGTTDDEPGRDTPAEDDDTTADANGCSASHIPSNGVPYSLATLALLGAFMRRRRS